MLKRSIFATQDFFSHLPNIVNHHQHLTCFLPPLNIVTAQLSLSHDPVHGKYEKEMINKFTFNVQSSSFCHVRRTAGRPAEHGSLHRSIIYVTHTDQIRKNKRKENLTLQRNKKRRRKIDKQDSKGTKRDCLLVA